MQGLAKLAEGSFDEAEACLRAAIELDAAMASAWAALASVQAERGQIDLSCESARTALAAPIRSRRALLETGEQPPGRRARRRRRGDGKAAAGRIAV